MNNNFITVIYKLYPQVVTTEGLKAFASDGSEVIYDLTLVQEEADKLSCSDKAKTILTATDWTQVADCPLVNKAAFTAYRATVRELAINPVANAVFPELPTEQW